MVFKTGADGKPGDFVMAAGSPGGSSIPQYVLKTLAARSIGGSMRSSLFNLVDFGAANGPATTLGGEHPNIDMTNNGANDPLITGLKALGHMISTGAQSSGVNTIMRALVSGSLVWAGGTDPRREGVVLVDAFKP